MEDSLILSLSESNHSPSPDEASFSMSLKCVPPFYPRVPPQFVLTPDCSASAFPTSIQSNLPKPYGFSVATCHSICLKPNTSSFHLNWLSLQTSFCHLVLKILELPLIFVLLAPHQLPGSIEFPFISLSGLFLFISFSPLQPNSGLLGSSTCLSRDDIKVVWRRYLVPYMEMTEFCLGQSSPHSMRFPGEIYIYRKQ